MATGQSNNLLSKPQLEEVSNAHLVSRLYVVYDNNDYNMSIATLFSLINKATVGLGQVDNTTDMDKPVSTATAQALALKANASEVVSNIQFQQLVNTLSDYATQDQVNQAISSITDALNNKIGQAELTTAISDAVSPITSNIADMSTRLTTIENQIGGGVVSTNDLQQAIQTLTTQVNTQITNLDDIKANKNAVNSSISALRTDLETQITNLSTTHGNDFSSLSTTISGVQNTLASLSSALEGKVDKNNSVTPQIQQAIENGISNYMLTQTGFVSIGDRQW